MCLRLGILVKTSSEATTPETSCESTFPRRGTLNVSDEYANIVKTKSYEVFRKQAYGISRPEIAENGQTSDHSDGFWKDLLRPDQKSVNAIIQNERLSDEPELCKLISHYFNSTKDAYKICGILHKNIETARRAHCRIQNILGVMPTAGVLREEQCHLIIENFEVFVRADNPFAESVSANIDSCFRDLLKGMKLSHKRLHTKLKCVERYSCPALCICGVVVVSIFAVLALASGPDAVCFPVNYGRKRLRVWDEQRKQVDIAVRGCYGLSNHVDTMSRLVTSLHNQMEQSKCVMRWCLHTRQDRYLVEEVARMLKKNNNFMEDLQELEEYVCLCCMTINRARMRLFEEIQKATERSVKPFTL